MVQQHHQRQERSLQREGTREERIGRKKKKTMTKKKTRSESISTKGREITKAKLCIQVDTYLPVDTEVSTRHTRSFPSSMIIYLLKTAFQKEKIE
mmetsp:Transcript_26207/g.34868  ORF Transcript_26207/g.34868 Transcript_26207/m.34868 type:complete len:95 (+) Transcript_26207:2149-2433(+)